MSARKLDWIFVISCVWIFIPMLDLAYIAHILRPVRKIFPLDSGKITEKFGDIEAGGWEIGIIDKCLRGILDSLRCRDICRLS